jgi:hypothetical protein
MPLGCNEVGINLNADLRSAAGWNALRFEAGKDWRLAILANYSAMGFHPGGWLHGMRRRASRRFGRRRELIVGKGAFLESFSLPISGCVRNAGEAASARR